MDRHALTIAPGRAHFPGSVIGIIDLRGEGTASQWTATPRQSRRSSRTSPHRLSAESSTQMTRLQSDEALPTNDRVGRPTHPRFGYRQGRVNRGVKLPTLKVENGNSKLGNRKSPEALMDGCFNHPSQVTKHSIARWSDESRIQWSDLQNADRQEPGSRAGRRTTRRPRIPRDTAKSGCVISPAWHTFPLRLSAESTCEVREQHHDGPPRPDNRAGPPTLPRIGYRQDRASK